MAIKPAYNRDLLNKICDALDLPENVTEVAIRIPVDGLAILKTEQVVLDKDQENFERVFKEYLLTEIEPKEATEEKSPDTEGILGR